MLDKNGRLFGKINIIDLVVVLALLLGAGAFALSRLNRAEDTTATLVVQYYAEAVPENVARSVSAGDKLSDYTVVNDLGVCTDVEIGESKTYILLPDGTYTVSPKAGFVSLLITGEVQGRKTDIGADIGDYRYGVGHTFTLIAGDARFSLRVYDIQVKEGE